MYGRTTASNAETSILRNGKQAQSIVRQGVASAPVVAHPPGGPGIASNAASCTPSNSPTNGIAIVLTPVARKPTDYERRIYSRVRRLSWY